MRPHILVQCDNCADVQALPREGGVLAACCDNTRRSYCMFAGILSLVPWKPFPAGGVWS